MTGDERYPDAFWRLVEDWAVHNPPQLGPNWKCGQEAAFRLMAWCFGLYGFSQSPHTSPERVSQLGCMVAITAERIEGNIAYALSQNNNHGISEAAGLFTAGILFPNFAGRTSGAGPDANCSSPRRAGRFMRMAAISSTRRTING